VRFQFLRNGVRSGVIQKSPVNPGFFVFGATKLRAPHLFYFLRAAAAASHPMRPSMLLEMRMKKNTAIGTRISIKNSPQNFLPSGGLFGKNQRRVYSIGRNAASVTFACGERRQTPRIC